MFTSRAEYRLMLDAESADERLTPHGRRVGLVGDEAFARYEAKRERVDSYLSWLRKTSSNTLHTKGLRLSTLLARPEESTETVERLTTESPPVEPSWRERSLVEARVKYAGYVKQQRREVERLSRDGSRRIPDLFDYTSVPGLSTEIVEKLTRLRPGTLGEASLVSGVTPAAVSILRVYVQRSRSQLPIAAGG